LEFGTSEFVEVPVLRGLHGLEHLWDDGHLSNDTYICGGFARYCVSPTMYKHNPYPGDLDIYCKDLLAFTSIKESLINIGKYRVTYDGTRSTCLKRELHEIPIQLIKPIQATAYNTMGTLQQVISYFDFSIIRAGFVDDTKALIDKDLLIHDPRRKLCIKHIHCPIAQLKRIHKYVQKGYKLGNLELVKVFQAWDNTDMAKKANLVQLLQKADPTKDEWAELQNLLYID